MKKEKERKEYKPPSRTLKHKDVDSAEFRQRIATFPKNHPLLEAMDEREAMRNPGPDEEVQETEVQPEPAPIADTKKVVEKRRETLIETLNGLQKVTGKPFELPHQFIETSPSGIEIKMPSKKEFQTSIILSWGNKAGQDMLAELFDTAENSITIKHVGGTWWLIPGAVRAKAGGTVAQKVKAQTAKDKAEGYLRAGRKLMSGHGGIKLGLPR